MNKYLEILPFGRKQATATSSSHYEPIDSSEGEIRIIRLLPGDFNDSIDIKLVPVALSSSPLPQYDALSYVWGLEQCLTPASVNGNLVTITSNLDTALRYFRDEVNEKTLWVDAVCINQRDNVEKGAQVQMMAQIYSKAAQVLVWLGPAANGSNELLEYMSHGLTDAEISNPALQDSSLAMMSRAWFTRIWVQQEIALAARDPIMCCGRRTMLWTEWCLCTLRLLYAVENGLRDVMDKQAMEGVALKPLKTDSEEIHKEKLQKVLQHLENNKKATKTHKALLILERLASLRFAVELASGTYNEKMHQITTYIFSENNSSATESAKGTSSVPLSADRMRYLFKQAGRGNETMEEYIRSHAARHDPTEFRLLLSAVSHLDATDDRDKVFGILGMARFAGEPIRADYSKTKRQVYSRAMATIIRDSLGHSYTKLSIVDSKKNGLPTWVPELSDTTLRGTYMLPDAGVVETAMQSARTDEVLSATFSNDYQTLTVGGVELGCVSAVIERPVVEDEQLINPDERFTLKDEVKSLIARKGIPMSTVWQTLIGNRASYTGRRRGTTWTDDQVALLRSEDKLHQAVTIMCRQKSRDAEEVRDHLSKEELRFLRFQVFQACDNATLFFTDTGKLGLVIGKVAKGDIVAALFGVGMTFVLRRAFSVSTFIKDFGKKQRTQEPTYEMIGTCHVGLHKLGHLDQQSGFQTFVIN